MLIKAILSYSRCTLAKKTKKKSIPKSNFARAGRLLSLGTTLVRREVVSKIKESVDKHSPEAVRLRLKQAEDMVETLGQMKGAAMKAGQLLSLEASDLLPKEVNDVLRKLHDRAPPEDHESILLVLKEDLGGRFARLEGLSKEPIASASIGQVHSAFVDGQKVAVKVQYPGIADSIDTDLGLLKKIAESAMFLAGKKIAFGPLFQELKKGLVRETNYLEEAKSLKQYKETVADERFAVPSVFPEFSTKRILVMSFEEGERLTDWLHSDLTVEQRGVFGKSIVELILDEFFVYGLVQTDPNYGNFLYRPESEQIVLLDFGATNEYPVEFRVKILVLLKHAFSGDRKKVLQYSLSYDFLNDMESDEAKDLFVDVMIAIASVFRPENQPFNYADIDYLDKMRERGRSLAKLIKYSPPAKQMLFLNRKLSGMFHLLKDVEAVIDLHEYWQKLVDLDIGEK